ncbi:carbon-nitrogen family hydrolase [Bacillus taeanensis]|uniref:Carbon-nitrogen family hydrolase n=1 Tax=Bacillus taeanensis TaxID=273032 RepID=A0A366Y390_9BACI|nr:carbon-nitrogen family hydrolase [Bacillus taeanensis]RBW70661.1 carbon-nitrogen family hydrolase [Bacillus taeanensis]
MKFSIYQMDIVPGSPETNRKRVQAWIEQVVQTEKPDTVVLPEMWTTAYTLPELETIADMNGEPTKSLLQELAIKHHINIIGGSIANNVDGEIYNSAFVVNRKGNVVYQYDKIHLVPMLDEPTYLKGGQKATEVFELDGIKMGAIICYDLRFPELARSLALEGAQVLHILAEWPLARKSHWKHLQLARAIENQMYVVSANRVGTHDGVEFAGTSLVIDPWGDIVREGSVEKEETLTVLLDLEKVKQVRKNVPIFTSRVPKLYK